MLSDISHFAVSVEVPFYVHAYLTYFTSKIARFAKRVLFHTVSLENTQSSKSKDFII